MGRLVFKTIKSTLRNTGAVDVYLKAKKIVTAPPYLDAKMELRHTLWEGISSIHCHDGRQLGENNVAPEIYRENIPTRTQVCPHSNPDSSLLMNVSALESMMKNWAGATNFVLYLRNEFTKKYSIKNNNFSVYDTYLFAKFCVCLPIFQVRHKPAIIQDGEVDVLVATQFQLISGMFMVVRKMIENGESWLNELTHKDAETFFDYADENQVFVTDRGFICAGSKRKIVEFMHLVIQPENLEIDEKWLPEIKKQLPASLDDYFAYYEAGVAMELVVKLVKNLFAGFVYSTPLFYKEGVLNNSDNIKRLDGLCFLSEKSPSIIEEQERILLELFDRLPYRDLVKNLIEKCKSDHALFLSDSEKQLNNTEISVIVIDKYKNLLGGSLNIFQSIQNDIGSSLAFNDAVDLTKNDIHSSISSFHSKNVNKLYI